MTSTPIRVGGPPGIARSTTFDAGKEEVIRMEYPASMPDEVDRGPRTVRGVVRAYNYSPKGDIEGIILADEGRTLQVNVPPHAGDDFARMATIGRAIEVSVEPEPATRKHPEGDHPAFALAAPKPGPGHRPGHHGHGHGHGEIATVSGVVARLNYARHGEPNGVVLEDGDFLHLKPDGMRLVGLEAGQEVTARGEARPMAGGRRVVEARVVNGLALGKGPRG